MAHITQQIVDLFLSKLPLPSRVSSYRIDGHNVFDIRGLNGGVTTRQMMYFTTVYSYGVELPLGATEGEVQERLSKGLKEFESKLDETDKFLDDKFTRID